MAVAVVAAVLIIVAIFAAAAREDHFSYSPGVANHLYTMSWGAAVTTRPVVPLQLMMASKLIRHIVTVA